MSAIFCAYSVRVIMYTRACTRVRVYPSHARLGHGPGMHNYIHAHTAPRVCTTVLSLTLGACAARVTVLGLSVCLSVCLLPPPRAIRHLTRGTSGYSVTCTRLLKRRFLYRCFVKKLGCYLLTAKPFLHLCTCAKQF